MESVAHKTARTAIWGFIEKISNLGIQFLVTLILARLLTPSDYGTIAILTVFIALSNQVVECGFVNALIRKQDCNQTDYSTAFFFNIAVSCGLYIIVFLVSPLVASFYEMPILKDVLRIYGLAFVLDGLRLVHNAILTKSLHFKKIALSSTSAVLISGALGIWTAYIGWGVWALVVQVISASLFNLIFYNLSTHWRPSFTFSKDSFHYLWGFGSKMLVTGIISSLYSNIYSLVIGKAYDSRSLGIFNRGQQFSLLFPNILQSVFIRNSLPIMSELQDDKERLKDVYHKFIRLVSFIIFPVMLTFCVVAKPFILLILTEKWVDCVIYIQIFAINAVLTPASFINLTLLQVTGRTDYTLKAEIIKKSIGFISVFVLIPFGPLVLAIGSSAISVLAFVVNMYYARKVADITFKSQFFDIVPFIFASVISIIPSMVLHMSQSCLIMQILIGASISITIYFLITRYVMKVEFYNTIIALIKKDRK